MILANPSAGFGTISIPTVSEAPIAVTTIANNSRRIRDLYRKWEPTIIMRVPVAGTLFKFNRSRRLAGEIIEHAVHSLDLIDNSCHAGLQNAPRNLGSLCRHKV